MTILLTGFSPFHKDQINSSWKAIENLTQEKIKHHSLIKEILPVSFVQIKQQIASLLQTYQPDLFLMLGQASSCKEIRLERVAINLEDSIIADNENFIPDEIAISSDGEPAYFSNLPLKKLKKELAGKGIPVEISNTAGTFVCNCAFYHALHQQSSYYPTMKVGFIHVPLIEEQKALHPHKSTIKKELLEQYILQAIQCLLDLLQSP